MTPLPLFISAELQSPCAWRQGSRFSWAPSSTIPDTNPSAHPTNTSRFYRPQEPGDILTVLCFPRRHDGSRIPSLARCPWHQGVQEHRKPGNNSVLLLTPSRARDKARLLRCPAPPAVPRAPPALHSGLTFLISGAGQRSEAWGCSLCSLQLELPSLQRQRCPRSSLPRHWEQSALPVAQLYTSTEPTETTENVSSWPETFTARLSLRQPSAPPHPSPPGYMNPSNI